MGLQLVVQEEQSQAVLPGYGLNPMPCYRPFPSVRLLGVEIWFVRPALGVHRGRHQKLFHYYRARPYNRPSSFYITKTLFYIENNGTIIDTRESVKVIGDLPLMVLWIKIKVVSVAPDGRRENHYDQMDYLVFLVAEGISVVGGEEDKKEKTFKEIICWTSKFGPAKGILNKFLQRGGWVRVYSL